MYLLSLKCLAATKAYLNLNITFNKTVPLSA